MATKILIMGLPGAGKTTLATALAAQIPVVHLNADAVRREIHKDLGFSIEHRLEHARRMGWLCDQVVAAGTHVVADFVCPTAETRKAFGDALIVWVDRISRGRYEDTNQLFEPPQHFDLRVTADGTPEFWANRVATLVQPVFDPQKPTALFVGRYQPFHAGHRALIEEGLARVGQACIAVRDTHGLDAGNPYGFDFVKARIEAGLAHAKGRFVVTRLPNISAIYWGRDVGYAVERIDLDAGLEAISATDIRRRVSGRA